MSHPLSLLQLVHRIAQTGGDLFTREARRAELTIRQVYVLRAISEAPGASLATYVAATGIDRSTMTEISKRLSQRKLITRRRSRKDSRAYVIGLTDHGARLLREALPIIDGVEQRMLQRLPEDNAYQLIELLHMLADAPYRPSKDAS